MVLALLILLTGCDYVASPTNWRRPARLPGSPHRAVVTLLAVLLMVLSACESGLIPQAIEIGSVTDDPVSVEYGDTSEVPFSSELVRGVTSLEINAIRSECDHSFDELRIVSDTTGDVLHTRDMEDDPVCEFDRLVWDGTTLRELEDGGLLSREEPWPDDLYDDE